MRRLIGFGIAIALALVILPVNAQTPTDTPTVTPTVTATDTPTVTPTVTAIPTVELAMSTLITSTANFGTQMVSFSGGSDRSYTLLLAAIVLGFWFFLLIRELVTWYRSDD